jgi:hypothetical protein
MLSGAWWIPALFAALGALRSSGIFKQFGVLHAYIEEMEDVFSAERTPAGWEHFCWGKIGWVSRSAIIFWAVLLAVVLGVGVRQCWCSG